MIDIGLIGMGNNISQLKKVTKNFNNIQFKEMDKDNLNTFDAILISNYSWSDDVTNFCKLLKQKKISIPIIPIGNETIRQKISNINFKQIKRINEYFAYGGDNNVRNAVKYIMDNILNKVDYEHIDPPHKIPFDGLFNIDTGKVYKNLNAFIEDYCGYEEFSNKKWIGLLSHRSAWIQDNLKVEKSLVKKYKSLGWDVITVFAYGISEESKEAKNFNSIIRDYFSYNNQIVIEGIINMQMITGSKKSADSNLFDDSVFALKKLNLPMLRPIVAYMTNEKSWRKNSLGLNTEISWSFTKPEREGRLEPILIGCRGEDNKYEPIDNRIDRFCRRSIKTMNLRRISNKDKKIAIIIHSAPCNGVEATIGMGAGLDVFSSIVNILKNLKTYGYNIGNEPNDGEELYKLIMDRKAYSDFRWTSIEDIMAEGGALYEMPLEGENGYLQFYKELPSKCIDEIENTWGKPPGEGMVFDGKLILTGICFKNILVMVQPKRGCYGSKCTGEVCKILHDPNCPPPHQYIATYKYLEHIFKADAVVHVGTEGSLEFLPGKSNSLSELCYPDIVLGNLPNIYVYNAGIGSEGLGAKRRSNALIINHIEEGSEDKSLYFKLVNSINDFIENCTINKNQFEYLKEDLWKLINKIPGAKEIVDHEKDFMSGIKKLKNMIIQSICKNKNTILHVLGNIPKGYSKNSIIVEYLFNNNKYVNKIKEKDIENFRLREVLNAITNLIMLHYENNHKKCYKINIEVKEIFSNKLDNNLTDIEVNSIINDIIEIIVLIDTTSVEMENFIRALNGEYIEPGQAGTMYDDLKKILPTGRNLYVFDDDKIPTKSAYKVGIKLANALIEKYIKDEGDYPEKISMNMISLDITSKKGEQLSQILYLMGIKPVWDENERVVDIETISLKELNRPRIDVMVRISGILRDSYPKIIEYIDKAAVIVSKLDEPFEKNFVRKNTCKIIEKLNCSAEDVEGYRYASMRVFGDRPGTYGAGVDLALKASAWKSEEDLAKVFVAFSSYAYGKNINGRFSKKEFVENVKASQISYNTTFNKYDSLSSGFSSSVQGGFGLVKKVLTGENIKQIHGEFNADENNVKIKKLDEELKDNIEASLLNPIWKESVKDKKSIGGAEIMEKIQNVFQWQCVTECLPDRILDEIANEYANNEDMQLWFKENNKFAGEEITRRLLELFERKKWKPKDEIIKKLKISYIKIEGDLEEYLENSSGEIQRGEIEVLNQDDIETWKEKLKDIEDVFN